MFGWIARAYRVRKAERRIREEQARLAARPRPSFGPCGRMYMTPEHRDWLEGQPQGRVEVSEGSNPHARLPT